LSYYTFFINGILPYAIDLSYPKIPVDDFTVFPPFYPDIFILILMVNSMHSIHLDLSIQMWCFESSWVRVV
jgi:hypothetical protein